MFYSHFQACLSDHESDNENSDQENIDPAKSSKRIPCEWNHFISFESKKELETYIERANHLLLL